MARDILVEFVVNDARRELTADGGDAKVLDVSGSTAFVRYRRGHNSHCEACVMSPEDFQGLLLELIRLRAPYIEHVQLEVAD